MSLPQSPPPVTSDANAIKDQAVATTIFRAVFQPAMWKGMFLKSIVSL